MNVRSLRPNANLENLKKQAKQLLRSLNQMDPKAVARFQQYFESGTEPILKRAQLVLAREYGFASWDRLTQAVKSRSEAPPTALLTDVERKFVELFRAGDTAATVKLVAETPALIRDLGYQAHHLLRAFVDSNSGHCYKKQHLQIAEMLIPEFVLRFRDAVVADNVGDVRGMLDDDAQLAQSEFTAGRGIAQAIHHLRSVGMADVLLSAGANINARTTVHHVGDTPVGMQLRLGTYEAVEFLLHRGANPNGGLLKFMPAKSMPKLVPLLVQYGWDIDESFGERTLLHHDAAHGHTRKMQILLDHGAEPSKLF